MNLTGKQLVEQGIVNGPINDENIQQHGVDLNLVHIQRMVGIGVIPKEGKTHLTKYEDVAPIQMEIEDLETRTMRPDVSVWHLPPGAYNIAFQQGCQIPADQRLEIVQRSSMLRNGVILKSSMFDAGFQTSNIGTVMFVHNPIIIEVGARIAQAYTTVSNKVEDDKLYAGQFQNDQWRGENKD